MTVAAPGPEATSAAFDAVRSLADELDLEERSMGMTDDLEAAVRAGTTMVRIGRALFGERPANGRRDGEGQREADMTLSSRLTAQSAPSPGLIRLPGRASRHYAVIRQEKACHPRS